MKLENVRGKEKGQAQKAPQCMILFIRDVQIGKPIVTGSISVAARCKGNGERLFNGYRVTFQGDASSETKGIPW